MQVGLTYWNVLYKNSPQNDLFFEITITKRNNLSTVKCIFYIHRHRPSCISKSHRPSIGLGVYLFNLFTLLTPVYTAMWLAVALFHASTYCNCFSQNSRINTNSFLSGPKLGCWAYFRLDASIDDLTSLLHFSQFFLGNTNTNWSALWRNVRLHY